MASAFCARTAYPKDESDDAVDNGGLCSLINMTEEQWGEFIEDCEKAREKTVEIAEREDLGEVDVVYRSVIGKFEAMKALACLRCSLVEIIMEEEGNPKVVFCENDARDCAASISAYREAVDVIGAKLQSVPSEEEFADIFVKGYLLEVNEDNVWESVDTLVEGLNSMIAREEFPLKQLQLQFTSLLQSWETYLEVPILYQLGYWRSGKEENKPTNSVLGPNVDVEDERKGGKENQPAQPPASPTNSTKTDTAKVDETAKAPASPLTSTDSGWMSRKPKRTGKVVLSDVESDSDDDQIKMLTKRRANKAETQPTEERQNNKKRPRDGAAKPARGKPAPKQTHDELDFLSDSESEKAMNTLKFKKSKRKRYTEEEKRCLLEGVEKHGVGQWAEIRLEYSNVFRVNNRSNVNLKDLYRTLTKNKE